MFCGVNCALAVIFMISWELPTQTKVKYNDWMTAPRLKDTHTISLTCLCFWLTQGLGTGRRASARSCCSYPWPPATWSPGGASVSTLLQVTYVSLWFNWAEETYFDWNVSNTSPEIHQTAHEAGGRTAGHGAAAARSGEAARGGDGLVRLVRQLLAHSITSMFSQSRGSPSCRVLSFQLL